MARVSFTGENPLITKTTKSGFKPEKDVPMLTTTKPLNDQPLTANDSLTTVEVELGITKNLGNYETARISVRVKRPVNPGQSIEDVYLETKAWIEEKISTEVDAIDTQE